MADRLRCAGKIRNPLRSDRQLAQAEWIIIPKDREMERMFREDRWI